MYSRWDVVKEWNIEYLISKKSCSLAPNGAWGIPPSFQRIKELRNVALRPLGNLIAIIKLH